MNILELIPSLAPGGAERFAVDLTNEMAKSNSVTLLLMRSYRNSDFYLRQVNANVNVIKEKGTSSFFSKLFQVFIALYWIIKLRPDVVHGHLVAINWMILPSLLFPKIKFYFTVHNLAEQEATTKLGRWLRKEMFGSRIRAIAISKICADSFYKFYGYQPYKTINNGCRDLSVSQLFDDVKSEIDGYKKTNQTKVFINVARLMPQKNHQLLINAFDILCKDKDAVLLIIGDYEGSPEIKKELDSLVSTDCIHFLGTRTNIPDYLSNSDYFCLSSVWEGLPISLLEAGLCGCYPICTPAGGVLDVIKDEAWGLLSTDFTVNGYLEALNKVFDYKVDRSEVKSLYKDSFSMEVCAKEYINAFS